MPVTVDHFVLSNGDTAKYDYDGLNNKPNLDSYLKLVGGTAIEDNANLNSSAYVAPGTYICTTNASAATLTNCPTTSAFVMIVHSATGDYKTTGEWNYLTREIYGVGSSRVWRQRVISNGSGTLTFYNWHRFDGSSYSALNNDTQSASATGWSIAHAYNTCRSGACWVKFEASFSGTGVNSWVDVVTGLPTTDRVWFWQCIDDDGHRYKLRVTDNGELSVKNLQQSSTLYIDTTISYPINE